MEDTSYVKLKKTVNRIRNEWNWKICATRKIQTIVVFTLLVGENLLPSRSTPCVYHRTRALHNRTARGVLHCAGSIPWSGRPKCVSFHHGLTDHRLGHWDGSGIFQPVSLTDGSEYTAYIWTKLGEKESELKNQTVHSPMAKSTVWCDVSTLAVSVPPELDAPHRIPKVLCF